MLCYNRAMNDQAAPAQAETSVRPTVGRIVNYTNSQRETLAAIVTGINPGGGVSLCVFERTQLFNTAESFYSSAPVPGSWSWPLRVSASA